jgi:hypothetical protein
MLRLVFVCLFISICSFAQAQQRLEQGQMHYIINPKPNNILYRDTLYKGSKQFMQLFYRTRDQQIIHLYLKHQSNKVAGQILGLAGSFAIIFGVRNLSEENKKGTGWAMIGGGFASLITGGYLTLQGQRNLALAVTLFNQRHNKAVLGVGITQQQAGFVYKF